MNDWTDYKGVEISQEIRNEWAIEITMMAMQTGRGSISSGNRIMLATYDKDYKCLEITDAIITRTKTLYDE
jgi:hypothetical protein